jgi:hypothetical protein
MLCFKGQLLPTRWLAWGHRRFLLWFLDFSRACLLLSRKCFSSYYVHILTNILSACLVTGVIAEKGRLLPFLVFAFFWTCFVYDPIAYWMWNSQGWANRHGALDWAGGTPVHVSLVSKLPFCPCVRSEFLDQARLIPYIADLFWRGFPRIHTRPETSSNRHKRHPRRRRHRRRWAPSWQRSTFKRDLETLPLSQQTS